MSYNLLDEKWIPVLYGDGRCQRVGIVAALAEAGEIRQIAASNPMDRVAILRFLMAILYWCQGNPPADQEKSRIVEAGRFPKEWFAKLHKNRECFNLLGDGKRLFQDVTARRKRTTTDLIQEIPTGNNFWHFRHSTDGEEGLCPACCALGLLRLPLFSVSGLPDLKAGINGTPPVYVVPVGASLLRTLCLNWIKCDSIGTPAWEVSDVVAQDGQAVPLLAGLTLVSRRVWLHAPVSPQGACIACGRRELELIRACEYQSAGAQRNEHWDDPHVVYVDKGDDRRSLTTPDLTKSFFKLDKPWVSLFSAMVSSRKYQFEQMPVGLLVVGFATDKAKNIDIWERTCSLPPRESADVDGGKCAETLDAWQNEGGRLPLRMRTKKDRRRRVELGAALTAIRPHVESRVSGNIAGLLGHPDEAWPAAVDEYRRMMPVIASALAPGFTTRALQRQNQIKSAVPNMQNEPEPKAKKAKARKGEGK